MRRGGAFHRSVGPAGVVRGNGTPGGSKEPRDRAARRDRRDEVLSATVWRGALRGAARRGDCGIRTPMRFLHGRQNRESTIPRKNARGRVGTACAVDGADEPTRRIPMLRSSQLRPFRLLGFAAALLIAGSACAGGSEPDIAQNQAALQATEPGLDHEGNPPRRPKACQSDQDCNGACPPGSKGCTCATTPRGDKICAPSCAADADCPVPPGAPPGKCNQGVCAPPPPPPRPKACQSTDDCRDACPPDARGCTCAATPHGDKVCAPTCSADSDCPSVPGVPPLHCREGVCAPPPPDQHP